MTKTHGNLGTTRAGATVRIDVPRLAETRLLIQANSGGGKSYAIRKLLEETHGQIQHVVLDMEGEFATLRERFDYVLAGKGGDVPADPKSAGLLARKVLELGVSLIVDLYELKQRDRIRFVKEFLEAMVNAPKDLWHPVLVVVDEAHVFAPEKGQSEAMGAVIDLATRGRKRGFAAVLATQRLSKLHKDVAAECLNKLIGRTGLDIDMKRAADELGLTAKADMLQLRSLAPGEFFAFGPALGEVVTRLKVGQVATRHPKSGQRAQSAPPPPTKVREMLAKLADLPKEAEREAHDVAGLTKRVKELERELKAAAKATPAPDPEALAGAEARGWRNGAKATAQEIIDHAKGLGLKAGDVTFKPRSEALKTAVPARERKLASIHPAGRSGARPPSETAGGDPAFGRCERLILKFLAMREAHWFTKVQVGAMTGYSSGSGGFNNAISKLHQAGLVARDGGRLSLHSEASDKVIELLGPEYSAPDGDALRAWLPRLGKCARVIYEQLLADPELSFKKDDLGGLTGYSSSSGGFNNALSELCTLGLAARVAGGEIQLNPEVASL